METISSSLRWLIFTVKSNADGIIGVAQNKTRTKLSELLCYHDFYVKITLNLKLVWRLFFGAIHPSNI